MGLRVPPYSVIMLAIFSLLRVPTFLFDFLALIGSHVPCHDEQQMEKFKACEKEMKTKAFSKEGLIQAAKLDPKEQEKEEAIGWVNHQVEELQMQVEATEAEVEGLQGTGKKRNKGGQSNAGRQEELEHLNERRKWHISRLEIVLRMLNNGSLPLEKVNGLKDDVGYFVESNTVRLDRSESKPNEVDTSVYRRRISMKMKASMMNLSSTKRKKNSVLLQMTTTVTILTKSVKVRVVGLSLRT